MNKFIFSDIDFAFRTQREGEQEGTIVRNSKNLWSRVVGDAAEIRKEDFLAVRLVVVFVRRLGSHEN